VHCVPLHTNKLFFFRKQIKAAYYFLCQTFSKINIITGNCPDLVFIGKHRTFYGERRQGKNFPEDKQKIFASTAEGYTKLAPKCTRLTRAAWGILCKTTLVQDFKRETPVKKPLWIFSAAVLQVMG
jgi:hypothetical protein